LEVRLTKPPPVRGALVRRAVALSVLSIVLNGVAGGTAVVAGLTSGSLSLLGFGFDAAIDSVASIALVWRFRIETRDPERAQRAEKVAEGIVGGVLLVLAAYLAVSALQALATDVHPRGTVVGMALLVFSLAALPPLALAKYRVASQLGSRALRADSLLTGIAALLALVSLIGLGLSEALDIHWADAVGALVATIALAREGIAGVQAFRREEAI
jgi:divalent metal cation (Fe/Co/Zn/Cd) transporter